MPNKLTFKEVKEEFDKRNLILLTSNYYRNNQKLDFITQDGYKAQITISNLKLNKKPNYFSKLNIYTINNIQTYLDIKNEGVKILSKDFQGNNGELEFLCSCGQIFKKKWINIHKSTYTVCNKCAIQKRGATQRVKKKVVLNTFKNKGFNVLDISKYEGNESKLECQDENGYKGFSSYASIKAGKDISRFNIKSNPKYFIYNLNQWAILNNVDTIILDVDDNNLWTRQGIKCKCVCGKEFSTSYVSFFAGKQKCDSCSKSISFYERKMQDLLDLYKVKYISQYRIAECKNKLPLPFDFYLCDYDILVEVDGEGHYSLCYFNNCSREHAIETFVKTKINDEIKNNYCKKNNIKLIRIPYWDVNNGKYITIIDDLIKSQ